jgi:hypothetical protein
MDKRYLYWFQEIIIDEDYKLLTMLLNVEPIAGPSNARITTTTRATNTKIKAYSTSP